MVFLYLGFAVLHLWLLMLAAEAGDVPRMCWFLVAGCASAFMAGYVSREGR